MVFFTCNHCGESVKKPAVEKHYSFKCRGLLKYVSCMDCQKDFRGDEYSAHTRCITEAEKYSGKDYVAKEPKNTGQKKQESWMDIIRSILDTKEYNLSNPIRSAFQKLQTVDNVPRKKSKFQNFVSNCMRMRKDQSEEVWGILEKELDKMKKPVTPPVSEEPKKEQKEQEQKEQEQKEQEQEQKEQEQEQEQEEEEEEEEKEPEPTKNEDVKSEEVKPEVVEFEESPEQIEKRRVEREIERLYDERPDEDFKFNEKGKLKLDDDPDEDISADQYEIRRVKKSKRRKVDKEIQNTIEQDEEKEILAMVSHMTSKSKKHREPVEGEPKKRKSKKPEAPAAPTTATTSTATAAEGTEEAENGEEAVAEQEAVVSTTTPDDFKFALVMVFTLRKYGNSMKLDKLKRKVQRMFCAKRGLASLNEKQQQKFDKRFDRYLKKCNFKVEHNVVSMSQTQSKTQKPPRSVSQ